MPGVPGVFGPSIECVALSAAVGTVSPGFAWCETGELLQAGAAGQIKSIFSIPDLAGGNPVLVIQTSIDGHFWSDVSNATTISSSTDFFYTSFSSSAGNCPKPLRYIRLRLTGATAATGLIHWGVL